jgi:hypothetical protein
MRRIRAAAAILCLAAQVLALRPAWGAPGTDVARGSTDSETRLLLLAGAEAPTENRRPASAESDSIHVQDAAAPRPRGEVPHLWETEGRRSSKWGIVGSSVGLVAGVGLALRIKSEADKRYDSYLAIADPVEARHRLDAAERYDRAALIGWAMAQVSFVGLVYFLTRQGDRPLTPVKGEPLIRPERDGVEVGVKVSP